MRITVVIVVLLAILTGVYAFIGSDNEFNMPWPRDVLSNTSWIMSGTKESESSVEESLLSLNLPLEFGDNKSFSGRLCNSFSGTYKENGSSFVSDDLVSTKMACEGIRSTVENYFFSAFRNGVTYWMNEGDIMIIKDSLTGREFIFVKNKNE